MKIVQCEAKAGECQHDSNYCGGSYHSNLCGPGVTIGSEMRMKTSGGVECVMKFLGSWEGVVVIDSSSPAD